MFGNNDEFGGNEDLQKQIEGMMKPLNEISNSAAVVQVAQKIYLDLIKDCDIQKMSAEELMAIAKSSLRAANIFSTAARQELNLGDQMTQMLNQIMEWEQE